MSPGCKRRLNCWSGVQTMSIAIIMVWLISDERVLECSRASDEPTKVAFKGCPAAPARHSGTGRPAKNPRMRSHGNNHRSHGNQTTWHWRKRPRVQSGQWAGARRPHRRVGRVVNKNFSGAKQGYYYMKATNQWVQKGTVKYGNYRFYYGYRSGRSPCEDPRLSLLRPGWFRGRDCLDIGCNEGVLTLAVALRLSPRSIRGVDIDRDLVGRAIGRLRRLRQNCSQSEFLPKPASLLPKYGAQCNASTALARLRRVRFVHRDWLHQDDDRDGKLEYGTIMCMSVTKWVHLNWGDAGLKAFFRKISRRLAPGGYLVLEPQPWRSYTSVWKKRDVAVPAVGSLTNLHFRPPEFASWICNHTSLALHETIGLTAGSKQTNGDRSGFQKRQILVFQKPLISSQGRRGGWDQAICGHIWPLQNHSLPFIARKERDVTDPDVNLFDSMTRSPYALPEFKHSMLNRVMPLNSSTSGMLVQ